MLREEFKEYLLSVKKLNKKTIDNRVSNAVKVDNIYNLDQEYAKDGCQTLLSLMKYTKADYEDGLAPQCGITIDGNYYTGLQTLRQAVNKYIEFLNATTFGNTVKVNHAPTITKSKIVFKGDFVSFIKYIGGYTKNKIPNLTRSYKKALGNVCEYCHKPFSHLDAAHIQGKDRQMIIKDILDKYYKDVANPGYYVVDLEEFENKYLNAHLPLVDHFYFLCKGCHRKYDANPQTLTDAEILRERVKIKP